MSEELEQEIRYHPIMSVFPLVFAGCIILYGVFGASDPLMYRYSLGIGVLATIAGLPRAIKPLVRIYPGSIEYRPHHFGGMKKLHFSEIAQIKGGKPKKVELKDGSTVKLPTNQMTKGDREYLDKLLQDQMGKAPS